MEKKLSNFFFKVKLALFQSLPYFLLKVAVQNFFCVGAQNCSGPNKISKFVHRLSLSYHLPANDLDLCAAA